MMQDFSTLFEALTGNKPFPWQASLYSRFLAGDIPASANIPTGLGKTSVLAMWLLALASEPGKVPRRLVYVVNRRTVVDQTTTEAVNLRAALAKPGIADIRQRLLGLCALPCEVPLAISTLRGQFADNGEWRRDPARPAVIIGTVDMIGSGLLFSRYTAGFKTRPLHAGFLGQDVLLVHDEAHLEPAFQTLLEEIQTEQCGRDSLPTRLRDLKPIRILALSATSRSDVVPFSLTDDDRANQTVRKRVEAVKRLSLVALEPGEKLEDLIPDIARKLAGAVLVFVRSVENALKIANALDKGENKGNVIALTGTMRGKERDELVKDPRFQRFLRGDGLPSRPFAFLVCTSAGEVGVNISADHCVCDLSTYESMAQRFGRVNRFGERDDSTITVFHETAFGKRKPKSEEIVKTSIDIAREKTLVVLKTLNGDASPKAISQHPAPEAFSPLPAIRVATQIQFDAWALTSIRKPIAARPPVAPYLHGEAEWQPPETHLAWRDKHDFMHITAPDEFLEKFPLRPRELLRDTTERIVVTLEKLLASKTVPTAAWLVSEDGSVSLFKLCDFDKDNAISALTNATLILADSLGGLENGLFTGKGDASDVSGIVRHDSSVRDATADLVVDISDENDDEPLYFHWFAPAEPQTGQLPLPPRGAVSLADHTAAVTANARAIAAKLGLSDDIQAAVAAAAEHHDAGKARAQWQRAIGNRDYPNTILAKSSGNPRPLAEIYRHEFGSLSWNVDVSPSSNLAAHIVAAHHGRARPHFPADEIFDPERSPSETLALASTVPQRFAVLQQKYGRWGLAYLESILRAADYAASAGIVAGATPPLHTTSTPSGPSALPPCETGTVSLALDPANPGHYFACCGLFELASRLHPEATAHFDGNNFIIHAPTTLADMCGSIKNARITILDPDDKTASPLNIAEPFSLRIDWWKTTTAFTNALKVWAGTMEAPRISKAMQGALDVSKGERVLFDLRVAFDTTDGSKKVEPFYFDANRGPNADSRDVGFSPNDLGLETLASPAVEFLCLVGLQRAIPHPVGNRLFDYHLWTDPIPLSLLAAAVNGLIQPQQHPAYRFESWYRTSQRKHKAFLTAKPINQGDAT